MQILIDAMYINNGGGKVLLDFLITSLEDTNSTYCYLLDSRIKNKHPKIKESNTVLYLRASLFKRIKFYYKNKNNFKSILCFGNIPPLLKCNCIVFTYFHQPLYIDNIPKSFNFIEKLKFQVKIQILKFNSKNSNFWIVQNERVKSGLGSKFRISSNAIKIIPFFPSLKYLGEKVDKVENSYVYVSNAAPHKNHKNLIEAFCNFYDEFKIGELMLTVDKKYFEIFDLIELKQNANYPIKNLGFISHNALSKIYAQTEFLIFPSFAESFGLGLVEAIENNCNIIASDLPYTDAVCIPSIVFNPKNRLSIFKALEKSIKKTFPKSESKVQNQINDLIALLN